MWYNDTGAVMSVTGCLQKTEKKKKNKEILFNMEIKHLNLHFSMKEKNLLKHKSKTGSEFRSEPKAHLHSTGTVRPAGASGSQNSCSFTSPQKVRITWTNLTGNMTLWDQINASVSLCHSTPLWEHTAWRGHYNSAFCSHHLPVNMPTLWCHPIHTL